MRLFSRYLFGAILFSLPVFSWTLRGTADSPAPPRAGAVKVEFNRDIRPILSDKCFSCHGPDSTSRKARLRLDTEEGAKKDRGGYHAVVPGKPDQSEVIARITSKVKKERMPPIKSGKELSAKEIDLLRVWIAQGAPYQQHWSYAPLGRPDPPPVKNQAWPQGDIDRFILARLEAQGLSPSPEADKVTLIRRLYFDLTGLPPTPAEVDEFVRESAAKPEAAYEKLVDRLLASPHFGERMAIYWLDLVRYADTVGYHGDQEHHISPYRDWVIKAFNDNMPFDRFTIEQIAGDLLPNPSDDQKIATGYNRLLQTTHEGGAQDKEYRAKYFADRVRNLAGAWMGATVGCAECHNHKYDPYTQKDFYSLGAFFADIQELGAYRGPDATPTKRPPEIEVLSPLDRAEAHRLKKQIDALTERRGVSPPVPADVKKLADLQKSYDDLQKRKRMTMITVSTTPRTIRVLGRGDWLDDSGEIVTPATPPFLPPLDVNGRRPTRLDLARWLTSPDNPQTARVFVNRLWYLFFGVGLSKTLDDTGSQGEWPTHPELLDWLASEFIHPSLPLRGRGDGGEGGWNVKHAVRLLVTSRAYRQASLETDVLKQRDPENRLFARQSRFRLPAEVIRDSALAVSGLLVHRLGGPSAKPYQPDGYYAYLNFPTRTYKHDANDNQYRRGLYTHWQRTYLHPMLKAFDASTREECAAQRLVSNTPLQALTLMNDPTFVEAARVFAARIVREGGTDVGQRLRWGWRTALGREPSDREADILARLYAQNRAQYEADRAAAEKLLSVGLAPRPADLDPRELAAWTAVARAIFNVSEAITRN
jgi:mono/diheme cytochrome c family protein